MHFSRRHAMSSTPTLEPSIYCTVVTTTCVVEDGLLTLEQWNNDDSRKSGSSLCTVQSHKTVNCPCLWRRGTFVNCVEARLFDGRDCCLLSSFPRPKFLLIFR